MAEVVDPLKVAAKAVEKILVDRQITTGDAVRITISLAARYAAMVIEQHPDYDVPALMQSFIDLLEVNVAQNQAYTATKN